jgi:hypothetical protein
MNLYFQDCAFKTTESIREKLTKNRHVCLDKDPIPPEFRYRFPLWTVGYLDASLSSGQQKPSAENTTRASKSSNCSTILSTPDSKITS